MFAVKVVPQLQTIELASTTATSPRKSFYGTRGRGNNQGPLKRKVSGAGWIHWYAFQELLEYYQVRGDESN
jgi:hypothetical protein